MKFETGTTHFLDRFALTRRFEENLEGLLEENGIKIIPFGQHAIIGKNHWMNGRLKKLDTKSNLAALMIKFAPDYLAYKGDDKKALFFFDAKASITPVFFGAHVDRIKSHSGISTLKRSHIGEIEREAWYSYNNYYPNVAIIMASPYSPKIVMAEWVKNIRCLWCFKGVTDNGPKPWDCRNCPVKKGSGFGVVVNEFAGGSGTPHTNIDFSSMRTLPIFLNEEFGINLDLNEYQYTLTDFVKQWPLNKPAGRVTWGQYNGAVRELQFEGCTWLKYRYKDDLFKSYNEYKSYMNNL